MRNTRGGYRTFRTGVAARGQPPAYEKEQEDEAEEEEDDEDDDCNDYQVRYEQTNKQLHRNVPKKRSFQLLIGRSHWRPAACTQYRRRGHNATDLPINN